MTSDAEPHPPTGCLLGRICGLCSSRRRDAWPVKPLTPYELDRWFGEAANHEILPNNREILPTFPGTATDRSAPASG